MRKCYTTFAFLLCSLLLTPVFAQLPGSGNSLDFGGTRYVNIPNAPALNPTTAITLEAWIKADSWRTQVWQGTILSKDGWAAGEQGYVLRCGANGRLSFNLGRGPNWEELASAPVMSTNRWYHVAATWDGSVQRIYIDGEQVGSRNFNGTINQGNYDLRIGYMTYAQGGARDFDGQIDEVRIWKDALSPATLRDWMCQRLNNNHPRDTSLLAYYRFDELSGTTALDGSGNNFNGTLVGSPPRLTSGAALGDTSVFSHGAPLRLKLIGNGGDSVLVTNPTGNPDGLHLYYIGQKPNATHPPSGITMLDTLQYVGVFVSGGNNPTYDLTYHYHGNAAVTSTNACKLKLAVRTDNADTSWVNSGVSPALSAMTIGLTGQSQQEYVLGFGGGARISRQGPTRFCEGDSTLLQLSGGQGANYQWLKNGAPIAGATDSAFQVLESGTYQVALNASGCLDTALAVQIQVDPAPQLIVNLPPSVCEDVGVVPLSGLPAGGTFSGPWIGGSNFNATNAGPGSYGIQFTYTDSIGCSSTRIDSIRVLPIPSVTFNLPQTGFCQGDLPINLSGGMPAGGMYSGPGVSGGTFDPALAGQGSHPLQYTYTAPNGCASTAIRTVQVQGAPQVTFGGVNSVCIDQPSFQLMAGRPAGGFYRGPGISTNVFFDPALAGVGSHLITYVYTSSAGCIDSASRTIIVNPLPQVDLTPFDTFCADVGPITLSGGTPAGGTYIGPGVNNGIFDPSNLPAGTFPVTYQYTDPLTGCSDFTSANLTIFPVPPKPSVTRWAALLISSAPIGNQWYNSSNVAIPWAKSDTFAAAGNGSYYVIVTNEFGCVSEPSDLFVVDNVGIVQDLSLARVEVFPNPADEVVYLQFPDQQSAARQVRLLNAMGQLLQHADLQPAQLANQPFALSLKGLASGTYFLQLISEKGAFVKKIQRKH
jgi:hypothetical protein